MPNTTAVATIASPKRSPRKHDAAELTSLAAFIVILILTNLFFFAQALPHVH
jgi:hypothetical protein